MTERPYVFADLRHLCADLSDGSTLRVVAGPQRTEVKGNRDGILYLVWVVEGRANLADELLTCCFDVIWVLKIKANCSRCSQVEWKPLPLLNKLNYRGPNCMTDCEFIKDIRVVV